MNLLIVSFFPGYDIYYMFKSSTYLEDGLVTFNLSIRKKS